jgi:hypothetical protein
VRTECVSNNRFHIAAKAEGRCVICRTGKATDKLCCGPCGERKRKRIREWLQRLKLAAYRAYGGPWCACCGEDCMKLLTLDHINNDGHLDRKKNGTGGANLYQRLKRQGYPPGFQVLCFNCNWGRHANGGVCPHMESGWEITILRSASKSTERPA